MLEAEREFALRVVRTACRVCRVVQAGLETSDTAAKEDRSPVTVADYAVQALVSHGLGLDFPGDALLAEESAAGLAAAGGPPLVRRLADVLRPFLPGLAEPEIPALIDRGRSGNGGRQWVLDPVDGTKGFLRGGQYAVALALLVHGEPVLGVLGCPNFPVPEGLPGDMPQTGCLFAAVRGQGASVLSLEGSHETPVRVSDRSDLHRAVLCESFEPSHMDGERTGRIAHRLGLAAPPLRMDSQCKYAAVAGGQADIYLRIPPRDGFRENAWDHAAGWVVITEAGGTVTDLRGEPLDFSRGPTLDANFGILATNGRLHASLLSVLMESRR
ncbi:MAG: 3'(2'),5'-bisphosphate nucleotidase [Acidobacteria bacterium]|nr:3'(2'),5'-bisphosphate nucleotidase [Acidobacteriota bacterium]